MLNFEKSWRFDSPGELPVDAVHAIDEFVGRIVAQSQQRHGMLEHFKGYFAAAAGLTSNHSSSESWAQSDLNSYMHQAAKNAPLFIEAFYDACLSLTGSDPQIALPDLARINRALAETGAGYQIEPPNLTSQNSRTPIIVPDRAPSMSEQAQQIIQASLTESERLLSEGRNRPAVQEILWLLETVSTAFQGLETDAGTVQGKYFNKIADDLRRHYKGKTLAQILTWISTLHGFLSSPTGGAIRHGSDLREGVAIDPNEARLYCNLIRSYITFLISEHERLSMPR